MRTKTIINWPQIIWKKCGWNSVKMHSLQMEHLWVFFWKFSRNSLNKNIAIHQEYSIPNADYMLLLWSSISAAIVVTFLFILYSIWKMDFFRDYHRMSTKADDKKSILPASQSSFDISMFPSPHQIVPSFFPNNEQPIAGNGMTQNGIWRNGLNASIV